jgi:ABC-type transport system involved in multi-copper enzyme maturation permease subunit
MLFETDGGKMRIFPGKILILKELKERKYRYIVALILLFAVSGLFFIPGVLDYDTSYADIVTELLPLYKLSFPALDEDILKKIIRIDISLPFLILVPAFTSPFLGALEGMINEKENRTLEGLLTLPISDMELLIGKMGASLIVGICLAWTMFLTHFILIRYILPFEASQNLLSVNWLLLVFLFAPLISVVVNNLGMILAIGTKKLNTAANLGILILSPFFLFIFLINFGKIVLETEILIKMTGVLIILCWATFMVVKSLFNRETLILRY